MLDCERDAKEKIEQAEHDLKLVMDDNAKVSEDLGFVTEMKKKILATLGK